MARILILHASVGLGHRRAAEALGRAFALRGAGQVWIEDTLAHGPALFRQLYAGSYLELSEKAPALWAYFYERSDENETRLTRDLRAFVERLGTSGLAALVRRCQPDAIVCTHFLPLELLADWRRREAHAPLLVCVVTDYTGHVFWVKPEVDRYCVATPLTGQMLARRGVPPARIAVTSIPVDPAIAEPKDRDQLRRTYRLERAPVVTLMGSGLAVERVLRIVTDLLDQGRIGSLAVVAGRNTALTAALAELERAAAGRLHALGFVDYVDDLVAASDLVITKAGGLIVSEVLARGRPLVVIDPIPGQEEWNADYVVSAGAGLQLRLGAMVPAAVEHLLTHSRHRQVLADGARRAGKPGAALAIADLVLAAIAERPGAAGPAPPRRRSQPAAAPAAVGPGDGGDGDRR